MSFRPETPSGHRQSAFSPDSPSPRSSCSAWQLNPCPSSPRNPPQPPFTPLRSPQRRPHPPHPKSKFLAASEPLNRRSRSSATMFCWRPGCVPPFDRSRTQGAARLRGGGRDDLSSCRSGGVFEWIPAFRRLFSVTSPAGFRSLVYSRCPLSYENAHPTP
jgi:hypothetical protein